MTYPGVPSNAYLLLHFRNVIHAFTKLLHLSWDEDQTMGNKISASYGTLSYQTSSGFAKAAWTVILSKQFLLTIYMLSNIIVSYPEFFSKGEAMSLKIMLSV